MLKDWIEENNKDKKGHSKKIGNNRFRLVQYWTLAVWWYWLLFHQFRNIPLGSDSDNRSELQYHNTVHQIWGNQLLPHNTTMSHAQPYSFRNHSSDCTNRASSYTLYWRESYEVYSILLRLSKPVKICVIRGIISLLSNYWRKVGYDEIGILCMAMLKICTELELFWNGYQQSQGCIYAKYLIQAPVRYQNNRNLKVAQNSIHWHFKSSPRALSTVASTMSSRFIPRGIPASRFGWTHNLARTIPVWNLILSFPVKLTGWPCRCI